MGRESFLKTQEVHKITAVNELCLRSSSNFRWAVDRYQQEKNLVFSNYRDQTKTLIIERLGLKKPATNRPTEKQTESAGKTEKVTWGILCKGNRRTASR